MLFLISLESTVVGNCNISLHFIHSLIFDIFIFILEQITICVNPESNTYVINSEDSLSVTYISRIHLCITYTFMYKVSNTF